jgi:hypothetical protein
MPYYCHLYSAGSVADTNLQIYSLEKAAYDWNALVDEITAGGHGGVHNLREKLTFILSCLGLSRFQLLGQNSPSPDKDKIGHPIDLLNSILARGHVDQTTRRRLKSTFKDFLSYYDSVRYFGKNRDERNYRTIEKLTIQELDRFRRMTIEIWDVVISIYRDDDQNDFGLVRSISQVVWYKNLAEQSGGSDFG